MLKKCKSQRFPFSLIINELIWVRSQFRLSTFATPVWQQCGQGYYIVLSLYLLLDSCKTSIWLKTRCWNTFVEWFLYHCAVYPSITCSRGYGSKVYFYACYLAYILGLGLTIFVMHYFKHAQVCFDDSTLFRTDKCIIIRQCYIMSICIY